ncbi:glucosamine-6-phosphate deaminase [Marininema mesophilum]|uniref:Glucosamine-6-phosphate deaminase n=1 Tax=Marininema mesophilum TaxID=1048340 RepID=A0A1H2QX52_9BACL|nr:glucosamine-6-phosphate deaminase [Marininema mesophilum]SDW11701.1 glucosamine-6-phosphate deaminase [Marininema mesophilum]
MEIIAAANYEEMSQMAATFLMHKVCNARKVTLGLATGGTPLGTYRRLVKYHQVEGISFQGVQTFNLDEYVGLGKMHPGSYHSYMETHLFRWIDIDPCQTHLPNGEAVDLKLECARYEELIRSRGGIDIQVLGIGSNGHIGFNEPGTPFDTRTHVVALADSTRRANARYFSGETDVPYQAITMGIGTILDSRQILLLASGIGKAAAIRHLIEGNKDRQFPASALLDHPDVTVIVDQSASN